RKALKLSRQNHIHEDRGEQHGEQKVPSGFLEDFDLASKPIGITRRKPNFLNGLDGMRGGKVKRIAGSHVGVDSHLEFAIISPECRGARSANDRGHIFEAYLPKFG